MHTLDTKLVKEQDKVSSPPLERVRRGLGWAVTLPVGAHIRQDELVARTERLDKAIPNPARVNRKGASS